MKHSQLIKKLLYALYQSYSILFDNIYEWLFGWIEEVNIDDIQNTGIYDKKQY
jgi:hypothetical protein